MAIHTLISNKYTHKLFTRQHHDSSAHKFINDDNRHEMKYFQSVNNDIVPHIVCRRKENIPNKRGTLFSSSTIALFI